MLSPSNLNFMYCLIICLLHLARLENICVQLFLPPGFATLETVPSLCLIICVLLSCFSSSYTPGFVIYNDRV